MSFSETTQRNVASIALVISIIALIFAVVPSLKDDGAAKMPKAAAGAGGGGERGGGGEPGGRGGAGGGGGGRGGRGPSAEYVAKFKERVTLLTTAAQASPAGSELALQLGLERDLAKLMVLRLEAGGRRVAAGASEAWLKQKVATALAGKTGANQAIHLAANQAELDWLSARDRLRDQDAFAEATNAIANYPATAVSDEQLAQLLQAEQAGGQGGPGGPGGP